MSYLRSHSRRSDVCRGHTTTIPLRLDLSAHSCESGTLASPKGANAKGLTCGTSARAVTFFPACTATSYYAVLCSRQNRPLYSTTMALENNLTLAILRDAEAGKYGILAQTCYDAHSVIGLIRAAERKRSPAILQLFPVTLAYGGGPFLQFCLNAAHQASVPISVHLDHATDPEHIELALSLAEQGIAFDSIMVDASHADTDEENIALARPHVERAAKAGVAVEVELGRLEGGEAGLRMISDAKLTNPAKAQTFMAETGAAILSPSIGNLHGSYLSPPNFRQEILKDLRLRFNGSVPLCLHGTDELPDALFKECIANGVSKINVNSWARDPYVKALAAGLQSKPFPDAVEESTEVFAAVCERFFDLFESTGKA